MAMNVEQVLHMVGGEGETSYATNSRLQEKALIRTKPIVEEAVREVYSTLLSDNLVVADLGCSSGPNTLMVISEIIYAIGSHCSLLGHNPPGIQFLLNDLPGNDFNTIFKSWHEKHVKEEKEGKIIMPCYVMGVPGSFYGRLFPRQSVDFIHSSFALMWLSQVPEGLENDMGVPINKGNIYIAKTSPQSVIKSYLEQFRRDFSAFLELRREELMLGGRMVLTFLGRKSLDVTNGELSYFWGLLADSLNSMVLEGLVKEEKVDAFNLPYYAPSMEEVMAVLQTEDSFDVDQAHIFESNWDPFDDSDDDFVVDNILSGDNVAKCIRAVIEPTLSKLFGEAIMDDLFSRYACNVAMHLLREKTKFPIIILALKKSQ